MAESTQKPNFKSGEVLAAAKLNQLVEMVTQRITAGRGLNIRRFGDQIAIDLAPQLRPKLPPLQQMVVVSDEGDYLECHNLNALGVEGTQTIYVLKPWYLRRSPFDGETVGGYSYVYSSNYERARTEDDSTASEELQIIDPLYFEDCVIYAAKMNLSVEVDTDIFSSWIDVNLDARRWILALGDIGSVIVGMDGNQTLVSDGGIETIEFDSETEDLLSEFNTGTYKFTAARNAYYQMTINVHVNVSSVNADAYFQLFTRKNGAGPYIEYMQGFPGSPEVHEEDIEITRTLKLAEGDEFVIQYISQNITSGYIYGYESFVTFFKLKDWN
jgi:hypothetical protein